MTRNSPLLIRYRYPFIIAIYLHSASICVETHISIRKMLVGKLIHYTIELYWLIVFYSFGVCGAVAGVDTG